jgi:alpha 1,3-glucosidase
MQQLEAVDRGKFRTCDQTLFCEKHRLTKTNAFEIIESSIQTSSKNNELTFLLKDGLQAENQQIFLQATLHFLLDPIVSKNPVIRLRIVEKFDDPNDPRIRWENPDVLMKDQIQSLRSFKEISIAESGLLGQLGEFQQPIKIYQPIQQEEDNIIIVLTLAPFVVDVYLNQQKTMSLNSNGQFYYETRQQQKVQTQEEIEKEKDTLKQEDIHQGKEIVDYGEDGLAIYADGTVQTKSSSNNIAIERKLTDQKGWEESFGGHIDKKKFGPSSIGMDLIFHGKERHVYGIPEHASDFVLKDTLTHSTNIPESSSTSSQPLTDPYRLYNLDVFEYELDETMALYGNIPVIVAPNPENTVGIFWHNPSETFIDIETFDSEEDSNSNNSIGGGGDSDGGDSGKKKKTYWMSESGVFDLFLLTGGMGSNGSMHFFNQYTLLTGRAPLPPLFSIGYHQCRWNYKNEQDVAKVNEGFDEHLIPYDVLWLDIEHTNEKRYFTWDIHSFPTPLKMQDQLSQVGRQMVTIVDPHIKRDSNYYVHQEATSLKMYIQDEKHQDFHGWCWPGDSSYVDFTSKKARTWWSNLFRYEKYRFSSKNLYTWNDMNEPSVFNGPEVSMRKSCENLEGIEHREWHNLYGMYMQQATMEGQLARQLPLPNTGAIQITSEMERPFVLSRAFFAGSQRFGAIWTGDNKADWGHLQYATKMLLSMSVVGLTFVGADVGGFFGNPDPELLTRWYQAAAFQPFFRGHAHHDSTRREPWVFGEPHTTRIRNAIRWRYALLPYVYTVFQTCSSKGLPVLRPLWMHFGSKDSETFKQEDIFLLGKDLLIKPIVQAGIVETNIYLPDQETVWYHIFDHYKRFLGGQHYTQIASPIDFLPVFQRGGSIIARKKRVRRNSKLMTNDPLTLTIALDLELKAKGEIYLDDEHTFAYVKDNQFTHVELYASIQGIQSTLKHTHFVSKTWIERIEIYGFLSKQNLPSKIVLKGENQQQNQNIDFFYDELTDCLTLRKPAVLITQKWEIQFTK